MATIWKSLHIDAALTSYSWLIKNGAMVAGSVAPKIPVKKASDKFFKYSTDNLRRIDTSFSGHTKDGPDLVQWMISDDSYNCKLHALGSFVADYEQDNADAPLDPYADAVDLVTMLLDLDREWRTAVLMTDNTVITQTTALAGNARWQNYTTSDPEANVRTAKSTVWLASLLEPNQIVIPYEVAIVLADHPAIKNRLQYTDPNVVTDGGLPPKIAGLTVIEPKCGYETTKQGSATSTKASVWGKNVIIQHVPAKQPSLKTPVGIGTFTYGKRLVKKVRDDRRGGGGYYVDVYEPGTDEKAIGATLCYLFTTVIT